MLSLDNITNENNKEHSKKRSLIPDHLYRMLIIGAFRSGKANAFLNKKQSHIYKIYLYGKDLSETKFEFLIKKA